MTSADKASQPRDVTEAVADPLSRAHELHKRTLRTAEMVARTEEKVAATLDQLAEDRPHRAGRLKALSDEARRRAAEEWQWIAEHAGSGLDERSDDSGESDEKA